MKYKYTASEAKKFSKYGIDLTVYEKHSPLVNVVHVHTEEGHFEEFYQLKSTFIYYIIKGNGVFFLNDEKVEAEATDLVVIPPETRIHYFGSMDMVLVVCPAFDEKDERHVRIIEKNESPLIQS